MQHFRKKTVLVFSPDVDVARNLSLLLENEFNVICESQLHRLSERILQTSPALILADVYPLPSDIRNLLIVLEKRPVGVLAVLLHVYRNWAPHIEDAIHKVADVVFYKPVNVELVAKQIALLLERHEPEMAQAEIK
jgi:hypothetical protein